MFKAVLIAAAAATAAVSAQAATVTYQSTEFDEPKFAVSVSDDTAGRLTFGIDLIAGTGDVLGFGLNSSLGQFGQTSVSNVSTSTGEALTGVFNDTRACSSGCNFNGGGRPTFDTILRFGAQGSGNGSITSLSFDVATMQTLADFSFTTFGIRAQSTNNTTSGDDSGSVKLTEFDEVVDVAPVPLPAAGWGLLAAMASLVAMRRRRAAAA